MQNSSEDAKAEVSGSADFRRHAHEVVDWIADYLENIRDFPVLPNCTPGELSHALPAHGPEQGEPMDAILRDFREQIVPKLTHWNHPRFFAYFANSASEPGILGELLAAALNVNGMLWKTSPAATELEQVTLGWLREWIGLPSEFFGIIYDTASISTLHAIAAAREKAAPQIRQEGGSARLVLYTSEQSHSSVDKGAIALGIGRDNIRKVPVDSEFRMRPNALREMVESDRAGGKRPFCIVATSGTTSTTSIDPIRPIANIAEECGAWLHVDASYAGSAAIVPELRHVLDGAERAHSIVINPHKWLFTPVDLSAFYTREPAILRRAFSLVPEYLRTESDSEAVNYMDYGIQLGRRFRALKFWFVLRHYGREGLAAILRSHVNYAQRLGTLIRNDADFEVMAPVPLSVVCFRLKGPDEENNRLMQMVNATGEAFLSHTVLHGKFTLRIAIGNIATTWDDVHAVWKLVRDSVRRVRDQVPVDHVE